MKICVTGAAGFLGSHLAEKLLLRGHAVVGIDSLVGGDIQNVPMGVEFHVADCLDQKSMAAHMIGCDAVYHCAALAHEGLSVFAPARITRSVFDASISVFSAAIGSGVRRIIFCS